MSDVRDDIDRAEREDRLLTLLKNGGYIGGAAVGGAAFRRALKRLGVTRGKVGVVPKKTRNLALTSVGLTGTGIAADAAQRKTRARK